MRLRNAISSCVKRMSSLSWRNVFFGKALLAIFEKNVFFSYGTAFGRETLLLAKPRDS
jgi:hypothetical protein